MAGERPTALTIITNALRKYNAVGDGQTQGSAENTEAGRVELNSIIGQRNTRGRYTRYIRSQEFTFTTARQSYSIGATGDSPDFVVTYGNAPKRIEAAQLVLTNITPNDLVPVAVWNWPEYTQINVPALSSQWPYAIYYQPSQMPASANGLIIPYPAFPSETSNKIKLWWQNQLITIATADLNSEIILADGEERALTLTLAVALYFRFPKSSILPELKRQMREANADVQSVNVAPPKIDTTGGLNGGNGTFDYRSRQWT